MWKKMRELEIYVVKQGDTLYQIARQYGVSAQQLTIENGLPNPEHLLVGQAIVIPGGEEPRGSIYVNGYAYPYIKPEVLEPALNQCSYVTPFTYGFTPEGDLIDLDDERLRKQVLETRTRLLMHLSTLTEEGTFSNQLAVEILTQEYLWGKLADQILVTMAEKNFSGLDVDFEYVPGEYKDAYIAFLAYMADRMHEQGYFLITALAPKVSDDQKGLLYESHDYYGIGAVSDYVLLMTYEWGYSYGPPMAVAPIKNVERVLNYALTNIPPEKIYMGIPFYGYDWTLPYQRGVRAPSLGNEEALLLAVKNQSEILFDETAQTPYFYYTDEGNRAHVVWFEDARSINEKLKLIRDLKLIGAGIWNLMRPFPQGWLVFREQFQIIR